MRCHRLGCGQLAFGVGRVVEVTLRVDRLEVDRGRHLPRGGGGVGVGVGVDGIEVDRGAALQTQGRWDVKGGGVSGLGTG